MGCSSYRKIRTPERDLELIKKLQEKQTKIISVKNFDFNYYNSLEDAHIHRLLKILRSGLDNQDSNIGCYAMNPDDYDLFKPFFKKVLADYHGVSEEATQTNNWSLDGLEGIPEDGNLNLRNLGFKEEVFMSIKVGRNLVEFPLPGSMTKEDRINLEKKMSF